MRVHVCGSVCRCVAVSVFRCVGVYVCRVDARARGCVGVWMCGCVDVSMCLCGYVCAHVGRVDICPPACRQALTFVGLM